MSAKEFVFTDKQVETITYLCRCLRNEIDNNDEHYLKEHELEIAEIHKIIRAGGSTVASTESKLNLADVMKSVCEHKHIEKVGEFKDIWCRDCNTMIKSGM